MNDNEIKALRVEWTTTLKATHALERELKALQEVAQEARNVYEKAKLARHETKVAALSSHSRDMYCALIATGGAPEAELSNEVYNELEESGLLYSEMVAMVYAVIKEDV